MAGAPVCPCLIAGTWTEPRVERYSEVHNPSTGEPLARTPNCTAAIVDQAVQVCQSAFPSWRDTPVVDRARIFYKYHALLSQHSEELARLISREHGKTLPESRASVQRGVEMVEFACSLPALFQGEVIENLAPGVDSETVRTPLGVVAGITPFNFPAMVPLWMFPIALVCGNCFVLKPSPRVPLSANRIAELLLEAGLPAGVLSVVHGDQECVDALLRHPLVKAISFVGSTPVAKYIYETGAAHGKRVQAAGGAKNHIVIMPDADLDLAVAGLQGSAFGCAGERCMAGSLALPVGRIADELVERLAGAAAGMRVGRTDTGATDVDMGPLITRQHQQRVREYIGVAEQEGGRLALDGREVSVADAPNGFWVGPTIVDHVRPEARLAREEVFGPVLSVSRVESLEQAIALGDQCEYGNGAVIFTRSGHAAREFKRRFNAGMVGVNLGVPAPMAWFPFTGWNHSFFGDLHIQGREGMQFYSRLRMTMTRWPGGAENLRQDPVWRPAKAT